MHLAVCSEKDWHIAALRDRIDSLEERLKAPIAVTVTLPKDFAVLQPAVVSNKRKAKPQDPDQPAPLTVNYADCDEKDNVQIAALAVAKYGRGPHNTYELNLWVSGIKTEIRAAKSALRRERLKDQEKPAETDQT